MKLDKTNQQEEKSPREIPRIRDPFVHMFRSLIKLPN